jgi:pyruvate dehydrogenase E1 component alpha subunit
MPDHLEDAHHHQIHSWSEAGELSAYGMMLQIRRFEEKAAQLYAMGQIPALAPLSIGQEAVAAGLVLAAGATDTIIAASRRHGLMLARGIAPEQLMASLLATANFAGSPQDGTGTVDDLAKALRTRYVHVPSATLAPLTTVIEQTLTQIVEPCSAGQAVVWCIGDGSDDGDAYFDTIIRAAAEKLPVVFVIENASSNPPDVGLCTAVPSALSQRCEAAGVQTVLVNGLDVRHVHAATSHALAGARLRRGPVVLDMMTYRYRGHASLGSGSAARKDRPREETDPVAKARQRIALEGGAPVEIKLKEIEQAVRAEISAALNVARAASTAA